MGAPPVKHVGATFQTTPAANVMILSSIPPARKINLNSGINLKKLLALVLSENAKYERGSLRYRSFTFVLLIQR